MNKKIVKSSFAKMPLNSKPNIKNHRGKKRSLETSGEDNPNLNAKKLKTSSIEDISNTAKYIMVEMSNTPRKRFSFSGIDTSESLRCRRCFRGFPVFKDMENHDCEDLDHTLESFKCLQLPFTCLCGIPFMEKRYLNRHILFDCECQETLPRFQHRNHKKIKHCEDLDHTMESFKCLQLLFTCLCGIPFMEKRYLNRHKLFDCEKPTLLM